MGFGETQSLPDSQLSSNLKTIGLTGYEARSLLALMTIGVGTARDVARESGIPYPSAYDSLRSLTRSGWVEFSSTRPSIFRVREPALMKQKIIENLGETFDRLQQQYDNIKEESSRLALIYTIVGEEHVRTKILDLLESAKSAVTMVIPSSNLLKDEKVQSSNPIQDKLVETVSRLASEGQAKIRIITDRNLSSLSGLQDVEVRLRESILAVDLLIDQQMAMIGLPDLSVCGWIDSPLIASHFVQFLELLWRDSKQIRTRKKIQTSVEG